MKKLNTAGLWLAKILELLHWGAEAAMLVLLVLSLAAKNWLCGWLAQGVPAFGSSLTTYGFELTIAGAGGAVNPTAVTLFSVGAALIFALMAMVFRNVYLIFKTAQGKTSFSVGGTPFQKDITRMVREIGIFYISVPAVGLIMSVVSRLVLGAEHAEISVGIEGVITGILLLCLSQVFAYGSRLQGDVDGLL